MDRTHWSLVNLPQLQAKCASRPAGLTVNPRGLMPMLFRVDKGVIFEYFLTTTIGNIKLISSCCLGFAGLCGPGIGWRLRLVCRPVSSPRIGPSEKEISPYSLSYFPSSGFLLAGRIRWSSLVPGTPWTAWRTLNRISLAQHRCREHPPLQVATGIC